MDVLKKQIRQKLIAGCLVDLCSKSEYLIFRDAWCTQERVIRFTTQFFRCLFVVTENQSGKWHTGDFVMYEAHNDIDRLIVNCVLDMSDMTPDTASTAQKIITALSCKNEVNAHQLILKSWNLSRTDGDDNLMLSSFEELINREIPRFEFSIKEKMNDTVPENDPLTEGERERILSQKYERNPKARAACLAYHGTACVVCGMDFEKTYGPDFAGKIEVHHIVPLSEIKENYVVDPIHDLIPVCPNCHTALHSKKNGVYTIDELKKMRSERK